MKYFALLTKLGENLLAQATALGTKLELTHMAVGDGGGSLPTPDTNQTKLIAEKRRAAINTLFIDDKNKNQIIAEQIIPEQDGGWWIREIGLFDKAGNLIAVANCPETYKPQLAEGSGRTQSIRMVLVVSHTESVTLKIDPSVVLATREYVNTEITVLDKKIDALSAQTKLDLNKKFDKENISGVLGNDNDKVPSLNLLATELGKKQPSGNYLRVGDYGIGGELPPQVTDANDAKKGGIYSPAGAAGVNFYDPYAPMFAMNRNGVYIRQFQITSTGKIAARDIKGEWKVYSDDEELKKLFQPTGNYADGNLYRIGDSKNESWIYTPDKSKVFNVNNTGLSGVYDWNTNRYLWGFNAEGTMSSGLIPIACGGTGARNATDARKNLNAVGVGDYGIGTAYPQAVNDANTLSACGFFAGSGETGKNFMNPFMPILVMNRDNRYRCMMQIDPNGKIGTRFNDGAWQTYPTMDEFNAKKSLGEGQRWTDVKGSRSSGASYTNSTGRTIAISVSTVGAQNSSSVSIYVDNVLCSNNNIGGNANADFTRHSVGYAIIPAGSTYKVEASSIGLWAELR
ncbi:TPA: phage tail protein [Providencia rettgeri]